MNKVIIEKNGPVKTVWMNRPEKRNALDSELLGNMIEALQAPVAADDRVLVIRGKGDVFCAGLDMAERSKSAGAGKASGIEVMLRAIELCPLPVVAVVQGDAIAGGNELALHCDLVVASQKARFGMSLAQVGLAPNWFLAKKLMEVLGPVTTREMLLLGDPLPSTKLHALGLIARCVPHDQLEAEAEQGDRPPRRQRAAVAQGDEDADGAPARVPRFHPARRRRRGGAGGDAEPGRAGGHEGPPREAHRQVPRQVGGSACRSGCASTNPGSR